MEYNLTRLHDKSETLSFTSYIRIQSDTLQHERTNDIKRNSE